MSALLTIVKFTDSTTANNGTGLDNEDTSSLPVIQPANHLTVGTQ